MYTLLHSALGVSTRSADPRHPDIVNLLPGTEVAPIRNVSVTPNKYFLKTRDGQIWDVTDNQDAYREIMAIMGPCKFF